MVITETTTRELDIDDGGRVVGWGTSKETIRIQGGGGSPHMFIEPPLYCPGRAHMQQTIERLSVYGKEIPDISSSDTSDTSEKARRVHVPARFFKIGDAFPGRQAKRSGAPLAMVNGNYITGGSVAAARRRRSVYRHRSFHLVSPCLPRLRMWCLRRFKKYRQRSQQPAPLGIPTYIPAGPRDLGETLDLDVPPEGALRSIAIQPMGLIWL